MAPVWDLNHPNPRSGSSAATPSVPPPLLPLQKAASATNVAATNGAPSSAVLVAMEKVTPRRAGSPTPRRAGSPTPRRLGQPSGFSSPVMPNPPAFSSVTDGRECISARVTPARTVTPARNAPPQQIAQVFGQISTPRVFTQTRVAAPPAVFMQPVNASTNQGSPQHIRPASPVRTATVSGQVTPSGLPLVAFGDVRRLAAPGPGYQKGAQCQSAAAPSGGQRTLLKTSSAGALISTGSYVGPASPPSRIGQSSFASFVSGGSALEEADLGPRLARFEMELSEAAQQRQQLASTVAESTKKMADMVAEAIRDVGVYDVLASRVDALQEWLGGFHKRIDEVNGGLEQRVGKLESSIGVSSAPINVEGYAVAADYASMVERLNELESRICEDLPALIQQAAIATSLTEGTKTRVNSLEELLIGASESTTTDLGMEARVRSMSAEFRELESSTATSIEDIRNEMSGRVDKVWTQCLEAIQKTGLDTLNAKLAQIDGEAVERNGADACFAAGNAFIQDECADLIAATFGNVTTRSLGGSADQAHDGSFEFTFEPGSAGLHFEDSGKVVRVDPGGQAQRLGITSGRNSGMYIVAVNGQTWTDSGVARLREAVVGSKRYIIAIAKEHTSNGVCHGAPHVVDMSSGLPRQIGSPTRQIFIASEVQHS